MICYKKNFDILDFLIESIIKLNNKFYKLAIEIHTKNVNSKTKSYKNYTNYYSRKSKINRQSHNNYKIILIESNLF